MIQLKKKKIVLGIRLFLFLTISGSALIFYISGSGKTWAALQKFHFRYLLFACLLILVDLLSGAWRIHIFTRKIIPGKSFLACFKANLANIFLAAATPFQTGGGVAQLYVLKRNGVPYAAGIAISVLNFVATLSLLFLAASIILTTMPEHLIGDNPIFMVMDISKFAFYFTLLFFLIFMIRPGTFGKAAGLFFSGIAYILPKKQQTLEKFSEKALDFINQYRSYLRHYWKAEKLVLVYNYILTVILYFNKCLVAYVIFLGLGLNPDFWEVVMLQMLVVFFLYFAPTPGASLIAETSTSAIMSLIAPGYILALFTVLWRFFTTYFGVILGSFVLLKLIGEHKPELAAEKTKS